MIEESTPNMDGINAIKNGMEGSDSDLSTSWQQQEMLESASETSDSSDTESTESEDSQVLAAARRRRAAVLKFKEDSTITPKAAASASTAATATTVTFKTFEVEDDIDWLAEDEVCIPSGPPRTRNEIVEEDFDDGEGDDDELRDAIKNQKLREAEVAAGLEMNGASSSRLTATAAGIDRIDVAAHPLSSAIGHIQFVIVSEGGTIVIQSFPTALPLKEGSMLCLADGTVLGKIREVFGPISAPFYSVKAKSLLAPSDIVSGGTRQPQQQQQKTQPRTKLYGKKTEETIEEAHADRTASNREQEQTVAMQAVSMDEVFFGSSQKHDHNHDVDVVSAVEQVEDSISSIKSNLRPNFDRICAGMDETAHQENTSDASLEYRNFISGMNFSSGIDDCFVHTDVSSTAAAITGESNSMNDVPAAVECDRDTNIKEGQRILGQAELAGTDNVDDKDCDDDNSDPLKSSALQSPLQSEGPLTIITTTTATTGLLSSSSVAESAGASPLKILPGMEVFAVPELSRLILPADFSAFKVKGSDASNMFDEELAPDEQDFSDDEMEMVARAQRKNNNNKTTSSSQLHKRNATDRDLINNNDDNKIAAGIKMDEVSQHPSTTALSFSQDHSRHNRSNTQSSTRSNVGSGWSQRKGYHNSEQQQQQHRQQTTYGNHSGSSTNMMSYDPNKNVGGSVVNMGVIDISSMSGSLPHPTYLQYSTGVAYPYQQPLLHPKQEQQQQQPWAGFGGVFPRNSQPSQSPLFYSEQQQQEQAPPHRQIVQPAYTTQQTYQAHHTHLPTASYSAMSMSMPPPPATARYSSASHAHSAYLSTTASSVGVSGSVGSSAGAAAMAPYYPNTAKEVPHNNRQQQQQLQSMYTQAQQTGGTGGSIRPGVGQYQYKPINFAPAMAAAAPALTNYQTGNNVTGASNMMSVTSSRYNGSNAPTGNSDTNK